MAEDQNEELLNEDNGNQETITKVTGMYKDWFLDYASYVILERAVPAIEDGFKPVQRRIMHSMKDLDDGRYNKVANIVDIQCNTIRMEMQVLLMLWYKSARKIY